MTDANEKVPTHDLSHEPERSKFNAEGWAQEGDNQGAAMILDKRESTSARVAELMKSGISEDEARQQAVQELEQKLEGKTADLETYLSLFSKVALTAEEVKKATLDNPNKPPYASSSLPFTARAILYNNNKPLLRYGARDGSIKEVRIDPLAIASVQQAIKKYQDKAAGGKASLLTSDIGNVAYDHIKGRLQDLGFHFEQSGPKDEPTSYDKNVSLAILQKSRVEQLKATEAKRASFDF